MYCVKRAILCVLVCFGIGKDLVAAEWELKGSLGQELQYNDNISLNNTQKDSVVGYLLTPSILATRKSGALDIGFQGQSLISRYDDSSWDCDNYTLGLNNSYRTNRSVFGLTGGYGVSCAYQQQIRATGIITPNNQSESYQVAPSWTWQWTSVDQLILNTSYSKTSFSNSQGTAISSTGNNSFNFSGNETYAVNLDENHEWSRNLVLNGKLNYSNVQYTGSNGLTQDLYGFQLGANYLINQYWTTSFGAGAVWIDTQQSSNGISSGQNASLSVDPVANISLSYAGQLTRFNIGYSNAVSPSSLGETLQTESFFANYSYNLAEHVLFDVSGNYSLSQSTGQSTDTANRQFDRTFLTAGTGIAWDFAKNWRLRGSYIYRRQNFQQDTNVPNLTVGTSESNVVMLSLGYSWDGIRISR